MGSDGVWETFSGANEKFGKERLKKAIAESAHGTADEIKDAILKALAEFRGDSALKDDVTFVVVKECHVPARVS
jgi:sigma-B regulation protein RsbU (phosphoserine phosphatase)